VYFPLKVVIIFVKIFELLIFAQDFFRNLFSFNRTDIFLTELLMYETFKLKKKKIVQYSVYNTSSVNIFGIISQVLSII